MILGSVVLMLGIPGSVSKRLLVLVSDIPGSYILGSMVMMSMFLVAM